MSSKVTEVMAYLVDNKLFKSKNEAVQESLKMEILDYIDAGCDDDDVFPEEAIISLLFSRAKEVTEMLEPFVEKE